MVGEDGGQVGEHAARRMWRSFEPLHAIVYFAPEVTDAYRDAGLKGFWMGYFGGRSAPLGTASAELVAATFFNFSPAFVARSVPDAWSFASPEAVLAARLRGVDAALRRLLGDDVTGAPMVEAADLAMAAARSCPLDGRALFAAHASLEVPEEAHLRLWHAATLLREHRGDGHVAALVADGLGGLEAHLLACAAGSVPRDLMQRARGWSDEEWATAQDGLASSGLLDSDGGLTDAGRELRVRVEATTDRLAMAPWDALGPERTERLRELLLPMAPRVAEELPFPNPMGLPAPD